MSGQVITIILNYLSNRKKIINHKVNGFLKK